MRCALEHPRDDTVLHNYYHYFCAGAKGVLCTAGETKKGKKVYPVFANTNYKSGD